MKLMVTLGDEEGEALARWAHLELRDPRDQLRLILRAALDWHRMLASEYGERIASVHGLHNCLLSVDSAKRVGDGGDAPRGRDMGDSQANGALAEPQAILSRGIRLAWTDSGRPESAA